MDRNVANPIAFRAIRAVLEAAHDTSFVLSNGTRIDVEVEVVPQDTWPLELDGLDPTRDGAWPPEVRIRYRWDGGEARVFAALQWWMTRNRYRHFVGITVRIKGLVELVWSTFGVPIARAPDGADVTIPGALRVTRNADTETASQWDRWRQSIQVEADAVGLKRPTPANVALCEVQKPSGRVLPSPEGAFDNLVRLALLKLVALCRHEPNAYTGTPPFGPVDGVPLPKLVAPPPLATKRMGIWGLPGGVREYGNTLRAMLEFLAPGGQDRDDLYEFFRETLEVTGETARAGYVQMGASLGLYETTSDGVDLTDTGEAWLADPDPQHLFDLVHAAYTGMLELLVLVAERGPLGSDEADFLQVLLDRAWKTRTQIGYRRSWLLSMGLTERERGRDRLTAAGQVTLERYPEEVAAIRSRIPAVGPEADVEAVVEDPELVVDTEPELADPLLVLTPGLVTPHLEAFRPPPRVLAQCCAALSAGRHLLLVGPPGTGKTVLAGILAAAAQSEGYCEGLLTATASADWTTFDTIGGYALTRDRGLRFKPGVFPRALARNAWLLVDELNRADVDKAFGELMTVLSHKSTTTPYEGDDGQPISIGPESTATYRVRKSFRVIATMNTWDKTSLFRLSSALQRRFATVHVGLPDDGTYAELLRAEAGRAPALSEDLTGRVVRLFRRAGLLQHRAIGPAVALDMLRYLRHCPAEDRLPHGLAEAVSVSLLSQLEGLSASEERGVLTQLQTEVEPVSSEAAWSSLLDRLEELFLHERVR